MTKIFFTFFFFIASLSADVHYSDMFDVYDEAKAQKKLVLIMLSQKHCPGCEYMEGVVFKNEDVGRYLQENFVTVHLDIHEDYVPEELEHFATPTFYFLDENENILKRLNGGENAKDFYQTLQTVHTRYKK